MRLVLVLVIAMKMEMVVGLVTLQLKLVREREREDQITRDGAPADQQISRHAVRMRQAALDHSRTDQ